MLKWYGWLGLILIILAQLNMYFKVQPFALYYIPIIWFGYIFLIDSIVCKISSSSLITKSPKKLLGIVLLSIPIWGIFEFYNLFTHNWNYINYTLLVHIIDFTVILPAVLESYTLFLSLKLFNGLKIRFKVNNNLLKVLILIGVIFIILPLFLPEYFYWAMWVGFFFLFDPINYLMNAPSILGELKKGSLNVLLSLGAGGLLCGVLWEFWNYWAYPKWFYNVPFVDFWHVFEMPLLGYLGYIGFGWTLYAMYNFIVSIISKKKSSLASFKLN